jgi:hypothetical protein
MMKDFQREMVHLTFSLFTVCIIMAVMWIMYPKLLSRASEKSAKSFWKAEQEANDARLFGGDSEVP